MTNENAIKWLVSVKERTIADLPKEALDIAIKALETGEVYMTGEDYNLYMEGYKAGKKDFEPNHGAWIVTAEDNNGVHRICCPFCHFETGSNNNDVIIVTYEPLPNYCENCGAELKGGAEE